MTDKIYMVAVNADYAKRVFQIATLCQDPDTGEVTVTEDGIDELSNDAFMSMTEDEFMAAFEVWSQSTKPKH